MLSKGNRQSALEIADIVVRYEDRPRLPNLRLLNSLNMSYQIGELSPEYVKGMSQEEIKKKR